MKRKALLITILFLVAVVYAGAAERSPRPAGAGPHGPPPEAFAACEGKRPGDSSRFVSPHGREVSGVCESIHGRLVLRPDARPSTKMSGGAKSGRGSYPIVDTGQTTCYSDAGGEIGCPGAGRAFFGQDAQHTGAGPDYTDNGDETVTDNVTGLMWQKGFEVMSLGDARAHAASSTIAGRDDWRLPTIKEMYSLIRFDGVDASSRSDRSAPAGAKPFMDDRFFHFEYGANGKRVIDVQYATSTVYRGRTPGGVETVFGVNMADGRIKGYPRTDPRSGSANKFCVKLVRGAPLYGVNRFVENNDGTIGDLATNLVWTKDDSKKGMMWKQALAWAREMNEKNYLDHGDWRLPNAKELHSIVDYTRSPDSTGSASIDPLFNVTPIVNEAGKKDFPAYWTSTTHVNRRPGKPGGSGVYLCFGRAMGYMHGRWVDIHGAGAQRSDPKVGAPSDWPRGRGPQGDAIRIRNFVRLVRDANG